MGGLTELVKIPIEAKLALAPTPALALTQVVEILLEAKADVSLGCKPFGKDNTALHQVVLLRNTQLLELLLRYGADVNAPGRDGWTPLGLAVRSNAVSAVKALLEAKADAHRQTNSSNGKTALEIATLNKKPQLIELLSAVSVS